MPAGTYTVQVSLSSPEIAFFNDTTSTITAGSTSCAVNAVCTATLTATGSPTIASFTVTVAANVNQGIELDFNLANAISLSNGTLTVNFTPSAPNPGVLTGFTLPRQNANLGSGQLALIEDFTGVVSLNGNVVTLTSPTHEFRSRSHRNALPEAHHDVICLRFRQSGSQHGRDSQFRRHLLDPGN